MLYQTSALGGAPRKLFGSIPDGVAMGPSWSPEGTRIAFGGSGGLYVASADGDGVPRVVATGTEVHSPRWSADGSRIAYVNGGSIFTFGEESLGNVSTSTVMVVTPDNGQVTRITSGDWLDTNPVWMPDNRTLLFVSSRGGGRDIYSIRLTPDGRPEHEPQRLTSGLNAHTISISADGKLVAYASYAPSANIWSIGIPEEGIASIADAKQVTFGNEKIEKLAISASGHPRSGRRGPGDSVRGRAPRDVERQLAERPPGAGRGVAGRVRARRRVHAGDEAGRHRVPGDGLLRPRLRQRPPRRGPVERRRDRQPGRARRRRDGLRRRRPTPTPRRGSSPPPAAACG